MRLMYAMVEGETWGVDIAKVKKTGGLVATRRDMQEGRGRAERQKGSRNDREEGLGWSGGTKMVRGGVKVLVVKSFHQIFIASMGMGNGSWKMLERIMVVGWSVGGMIDWFMDHCCAACSQAIFVAEFIQILLLGRVVHSCSEWKILL